MRPTFKSGAFQTYGKQRYSNSPIDQFEQIPGSDDYENIPETTTTTTGGSFNWSSFLNNLINGTSSVLTSVYGHNNQWQANAYNTMYEQEKRTNTILWVVIGLVLALGVFLVVRKK